MALKAKKKNYVDNEQFYHALVAFKIKVNAAKAAHEDLMEEWKLMCAPVLKKMKTDNFPLFELFLEDKFHREKHGSWPNDRDITLAFGLPREPKYVPPRIPEYIGKCIWLIAEGLSNYWKFCRYSYRDDMAADGIEDCILRANSFDPDFSLYTVKDLSQLSKKFQSSDLKKISDYIKTEFNGYELDIDDVKLKAKHLFSHDFIFEKFKLEVRRNPFAYFTQICYFAAIRRIKKEKEQKDVKSALVKNSNILDELVHTTQRGDDAEYNNSYLTFLLENVDNSSQTDEEKETAQRTYKKTTKAYQTYLKDKEIELNTDGVNKEYTEDEEPVVDTNILDFGLDDDQ